MDVQIPDSFVEITIDKDAIGRIDASQTGILNLNNQEDRLDAGIVGAFVYTDRVGKCLMNPEVHHINRACLHTQQVKNFVDETNLEWKDQGRMLCVTSRSAFQAK